MRHKPPFSRRKGWEDCFFSSDKSQSSPGPGPVSGHVVAPSCQRAVHRKRTPRRTPAHHTIHLLTSWTSSPGEETQAGKGGISFVSHGQLTMAEVGCSRKRGSALSTRAFCKLVVAARKERFGATPGRAVTVRRRWHMNSYFHSSTVFRARREAFRIFLQLGPVGLVKRDKPRTGVCRSPDFVFSHHWGTFRLSLSSPIGIRLPVAQHFTDFE